MDDLAVERAVFSGIFGFVLMDSLSTDLGFVGINDGFGDCETSEWNVC